MFKVQMLWNLPIQIPHVAGRPNESPQTIASVAGAKTPGGLFCFPPAQSFEAEV